MSEEVSPSLPARRGIDAIFTDVADHITEGIGRWWFTVGSFILLIVWVLYGIFFISQWFTSQSWNFPLNTITTVGEWFLEGFLLSAANRVEKRNRLLQDKQALLLSKTEAVEEQNQTILVHLETMFGQHQQVLEKIDKALETPKTKRLEK